MYMCNNLFYTVTKLENVYNSELGKVDLIALQPSIGFNQE